MGNLIPMQDATLTRLGLFRAVGRFMAHSGLHTGRSFVGLSPAVVEYILLKDMSRIRQIPLSTEDVSDPLISDICKQVLTTNNNLSKTL